MSVRPDVMIEPGRVGKANATIHLWNDDLETLDARDVTLTLTNTRCLAGFRWRVARRWS
jgi:hypothetical protein